MYLEKIYLQFLIFFYYFLSVLIFFIIDHSSSFKVFFVFLIVWLFGFILFYHTCICGLSVIQVQIIFDARQLLKREVKMIYAN